MQSMYLYINTYLYQNNTKYIVQGDPTKKRVDIFYCKQWVAKLLMTAFSDIIHTLFFFGNTYSGLRNNKQKHRLSFRN